MNRISLSIVTALTISSMMIGCGNIGGSEDDDTSSAKIVDSNLIGLDYVTNSGYSGVTDENGEFKFKKTDTQVTFNVGKITLGTFELSNLQPDKTVLIGELFGLDRNNTTDPRLLETISFLQSLDNDNDPNNGILITEEEKNKITNLVDSNLSIHVNLTLNDSNTIQFITQQIGKPYISEFLARDHYKRTLESKNIMPQTLPFKTVWQIDADDPDKATIYLNTDSQYNYNYTVDWGDGTVSKNLVTSSSHTYGKDGNYTITISGEFPHFQLDYNHNGDQLLYINQWGDIKWKSFYLSFLQSVNLELNTSDAPDLREVTTMEGMFAYSAINQNINFWDVSHVENMMGLFCCASKFNQPLNDWDMANVKSTAWMFKEAVFNQPIEGWNLSNDTNMSSMFEENDHFNQPLNKLDVSHVTDMSKMFDTATLFNQPLNEWNTSNVTNMKSMFERATLFNQPLNNWDVSNVTTMESMFERATSFNGNLNGWNTKNVTNMKSMFDNASVFNQNIDNWDVSSVTTMESMFDGAILFNQPLNDWNVSNVTTMKWMFYYIGDYTDNYGQALFNQPLDKWDTSKVTDMSYMFYNTNFNQNIDSWDVSHVTTMNRMFYEAPYFNQPLNDWNVSNVTNMYFMFGGRNKNTTFNQNIDSWDVSHVTSMSEMFEGNVKFNQPLNDWNVSNVTSTFAMFYKASDFNQTLDKWDTSKVTNMTYMFNNASSFSDKDLSMWNVDNVNYHTDFSTGTGGNVTEPNWP